MGQEFIIKSQTLEDKINQLLPSQGGSAAGVDLSASTQIVPIVDLTESAEGSNLRQDLQTAFSLISTSSFTVGGATDILIANTGYFRLFGTVYMRGPDFVTIDITDGTTTKQLYKASGQASGELQYSFDFNVFLEAGDSVTATSTSSSNAILNVVTRQLATISGDLVNP